MWDAIKNSFACICFNYTYINKKDIYKYNNYIQNKKIVNTVKFIYKISIYSRNY